MTNLGCSSTERPDAHLGDFLGATSSNEELDGLLAYALTKSDLEASRSLFQSKWWDYRYAHPGRCYYLFAHLYGEAVEQWRTKFGVNVYAKLKAVGNPIYRIESDRKGNCEINRRAVLRPKAFRTGLWRAMCFADAHGVPYDRFIQIAFEHAFDRQWQRIPLPSNLYGDWMVETVLKRWEEEKKALIRLPVDPRFMADAYQGEAFQEEFQHWLLDLIAKRPVPRIPLAQYLTRERYIVPKLAAQKFGVDHVRSVVLSARASANR